MKPLDQAIVSLVVEIESQITWSKRAAEVEEYRRGYREALKALGWQKPRTYWGSPPKPEPVIPPPAADRADEQPQQGVGE